MIKVTDGKTPKVEDDSILIQERYASVPTPNGQLQSGAYYSWKGRWNDMWGKFVARAQDLIDVNLRSYVPKTRKLTINGNTQDLSADRDLGNYVNDDYMWSHEQWEIAAAQLNENSDIEQIINSLQEYNG